MRLNALLEHGRTTTTLQFTSGPSTPEVGWFLAVPVSTSGYRLHNARGEHREGLVVKANETLQNHGPGERLVEEGRRAIEPMSAAESRHS
jgi:hypothetical protein